MDAGEDRQNSSCEIMQRDISLGEAWISAANESFYRNVSDITALQVCDPFRV